MHKTSYNMKVNKCDYISNFTNHSNMPCLTHDKDCTSICTGEILYKINHICNFYGLVKSVIEDYNKKIKELKIKLELQINQDFDEIYNIYDNLICCLRKEIDDIINEGCYKIKDISVLQKETILIVEYDNKNICFKLPIFDTLYYLQKTDKQYNYLYFNTDPNTTPYSQNPKVTFNNITDKTNIYPIWYFVYDNKISADYNFISNLIGEQLTYDDLINERLLLKNKSKLEGKKTVISNGKYRFTYCINKSNLILPDPNNPAEEIDPKIQGIVDGLYSLEDDIRKYKTKDSILITLDNTIKILEQLKEFIHKLLDELCEFKNRICYLCISCNCDSSDVTLN